MTGGTGMRRVLACAGAVVALSLGGATAADAQTGLQFAACGDAAGVECATATLPRDYDRPGGATVDIAVARLPAADAANRIGVLFFNFGGPGAPAAAFLEAFGRDLFPAYTDRFDIVAVDPRGVGDSSPSIDCRADQETEGIYAQPFTTPFNVDEAAYTEKVRAYIAKCERNGEILRHVSTANVARDMDAIRALLGEERLTYFGYSYGTLLGATYARLFPGRYRAVVLDGPLDAEGYLNRPMRNLAEQTSGFERALGRFFQACARDQAACSGFGGEDPWSAFDELVEAANRAPIAADGFPDDPRPVDGDDVLEAAISEVYAKQFWGELAVALARAARGDGSLIRALVDDAYDRQPDGTYGPGNDRYFTIGASEQRYPRGVGRYFRRGDESWGTFDHFWFNHGYVELNYGLWRRRDQDAYRGPFRLRDDATSALVVDTTYDPATPYRGGLRLVRDLGNARLLTMRGDGHTAYGGNSACIDAAVDAYVLSLTVPAAGTVCRQEVPFAAPAVAARAAGRQSREEVLRSIRVRGR